MYSVLAGVAFEAPGPTSDDVVRVVSWNLKDIGTPKLTTHLAPVMTAAGLGSTVLDYIVKVVMADPTWSVYGVVPADVFLVIELVSGGERKGDAVSAGADPTVASIVAAMNAVAAARAAALGIAATHHYASVPAKVTGYRESIGIIYNTLALTYGVLSGRVLRDVKDRYLLPRTPFYASFNAVVGGERLDVIGIHAPPPKGTPRFRLPVLYTEYLAQVPEIRQTGYVPQRRLLIAGDFNCDGAASFNMRRNKVWQDIEAFDDLINTYGYATQLPTGSLSSMNVVITATPQPTDYLNEAYDNIFYKLPGAPAPAQRVLDLIGNARNLSQPPATQAMYPAQLAALFANYWTVSDHLPVDITF